MGPQNSASCREESGLFAPHLQSTYRYFQHVKTACQGITIAYFMDTSATILIQEAMMDHAADLLCLDRLT